MTDRTPIDYSHSPSGSTIDFTSTRPSSRPSSRVSSTGSNLSWHPKLTLYRLLVIFSTVGLAAAKTATTCLNFTFASITLEWILGVVVFLFFYLLGAYEKTNNRYFTWLFNFDCMEFLWVFLENLTGFSRPFYISDEIDTRHQAAGIYPLLTGYRILVTVVVASFGMVKSALLYGQQPTEATAVECVFGVGIVTGLYLLGLYETSSTKAYPKLFHVDYSDALLSYIMETAIVFYHLFAHLDLLHVAFFYGVYRFNPMILSPDVPDVPAKSRMGIIENIVMTAIMASTISLVSLGAAVTSFRSIHYLARRYLASPLVQFIVGLPGVRLIPYMHREYWLPSALSFRPRPRFFYLKRLIIRQSVKIPWNLYLLFFIIIILIYIVALSLIWYSLFLHLLEEAPWHGLLSYFLISLFLIPALLPHTAGLIYLVYKIPVDFLLDAWKDFTVDVEKIDPPV